MTSDGAGRQFDLEGCTARFGEAIIAFAKTIPIKLVTSPLISQLVRAGTSIGANDCEADDASSRKEFRYRITICKKESRETKHWLRMIATAASENAEVAPKLWYEAKELHLIFAAIARR